MGNLYFKCEVKAKTGSGIRNLGERVTGCHGSFEETISSDGFKRPILRQNLSHLEKHLARGMFNIKQQEVGQEALRVWAIDPLKDATGDTWRDRIK